MKSPAFQFYAQDFLVGTMLMSAEAVGAYIRLLAYQWVSGGLPVGLQECQRIAHCSEAALSEALDKFERCEDGVLRNAKLESVRANREAFCARQAINGAKGGRPKSQTKAKQNPLVNPNETQPKALQSSSSYTPIVPSGDGKAFEEFWEHYPKKKAKQAAIKAWAKIDPGLYDSVLDGLAAQVGCADWEKDGGKYIPHPASWLNGRRWEDTPPDTAPKGVPGTAGNPYL